MSSKAQNYLIILLAVATTGTGLIAWQQSKRLSELQAELLANRAAASAVKSKPAPVASTFTAPALTASSAEASSDVEPAAPGEEPAPRQRGNNNRPNFTALMADPEFASAMSVQQRAALDARYADLFKKLNLPPAQLEQLKNLLIERQNARMDVMIAAREGGLNTRENRDDLRKLTAESQSEVDANIKATLGEAVYNQYQGYESTQPQRNLVDQLDRRLSYSSTPLNSTQTDFLVNALAASGSPQSNDQGGGPGNWGGGNRVTITDAVIQQAQSILAADQVAALKQLQAEQQAQQKVRDMMRANTGNGNRPQANRPAGN